MQHVRSSLRMILLSIVALSLLALSPGQDAPTGSDPPETAVQDLAALYTTGYILQDRNGDDLVDFVDVAIVMPAEPTESEVVAASNIAARLGYETTAMNLDLAVPFTGSTRRYDRPVIVIGTRGGLGERLPGDPGGTGRRLKPGQGVINILRPDNFFIQGGVVLTGYDASGLIVAARYMSARYPSIWQPDGDTYEEVAKKLNDFLTQREIDPEEVSLNSVVVGGERGVDKLSVLVRLADEDSFEKAVAAFEGKEREPAPEEKEEGIEGTEEEEAAGERKQANQEAGQKKVLELADLEFSDLHRIEVQVVYSERVHRVNLLPRRPWQTKPGGSRSAGASPDFTLSQIYTINGLFRDTNQDFVSDDVVAHISLTGSAAAGAVVDLASRIGLESAGVRLPLLRLGGEDDYPEELGLPIIFGANHYQTERLLGEERLYGNTGNRGEGYIQFVPEVFNERNGLVIGAPDEEGLVAVTEYIASRMPWLWEYGKGNFHLWDAEEEVRRFFQAAKPAGQASMAVNKLDTWLGRIGEREVERVEVELSLREIEDGLDSFIEGVIDTHFPEIETSVKTYRTGFGSAGTVFEEDWEIPWEVDEFWRLFRSEALPRINAGDRGRIVVRVSEPPEVRSRLTDEIEAELVRRGVNRGDFDILVLCAYKQGFSWLHDAVLPKIRDRDVGGIEIRYHTLKDQEEVRWQAIHANTRWLQEIFPVDVIMARELDIPDSLITFTSTQHTDPIYTVRVTDPSGALILEEGFDPKYVVRPFFDLFPDYEHLRVTTGWVMVEADGEVLLDSRIKTDPEVFWDRLQTDTFQKIIEYVMDLQEGRPSPGNAPYFDELRIDLDLSEPNYRLEVDEEAISSLEALHEDIFFETLTLFNLIGARYGVGSLSFPGMIRPWVRPLEEAGAGRARIVFRGREKAAPELVMTYTEKGSEPVRERYPLTNLGVDPPDLRGISVKAGADGLSQLLFEVVATDSTDRYEEFRLRGTEASIDRSFIAAEKLVDMVEILARMHEAGLYEEDMSFDRVEEMLFRVTIEDSTEYSRFASLPRSSNPMSTTNPRPSERGYRYSGPPIVQWETPIPPAECEAILARLNTLSRVNVYYAATSLLGQDVFVMDLYPPVEARYISQAKMNAFKPSLLLYGRVHGNEVSSTSHILKLAELCATDSTYIEYLDKVNLVLYPITNPDGAQIAYEMWRETPDYMLHVGRPGALGNDVSSRATPGQDNLYPEAGVVNRLREAWLPDVAIDMHGVPSHEWVQIFAGYSAWVRSRYGGARSYWLPRGWYIPGWSWIEDERYPEFEEVQTAIIDSLTTAVTRIPEVEAMNRRIYERYTKYGRQDAETYREYFYKGIQLEARLTGRRITGSGITSPRITYFTATTEVADETAYGDWMDLACTAGLSSSSALLRYLSDGQNRVEREAKEFEDYVTRMVYRKKPVLPGK